MRKKNCRKDRFIDSVSDVLDLPMDSVSGYAHIEMNGNKEIIIEGCQGVLEYGERVISINTGRLTVRICGYDMSIVSMQGGQAVIKGIITGIEFCN